MAKFFHNPVKEPKRTEEQTDRLKLISEFLNRQVWSLDGKRSITSRGDSVSEISSELMT